MVKQQQSALFGRLMASFLKSIKSFRILRNSTSVFLPALQESLIIVNLQHYRSNQAFDLTDDCSRSDVNAKYPFKNWSLVETEKFFFFFFTASCPFMGMNVIP